MRGKYRPHHILEVVLLFIALAGFSASNSKANENSKYLDAVREFADSVLKYGKDNYGLKSFFSFMRPLRGGKIS